MQITAEAQASRITIAEIVAVAELCEWSHPIRLSDKGKMKLHHIALTQIKDPFIQWLREEIVKKVKHSEFSDDQVRDHLDAWVLQLAIAGAQELPFNRDEVLMRIKNTKSWLDYRKEFLTCRCMSIPHGLEEEGSRVTQRISFDRRNIEHIHQLFCWEELLQDYSVEVVPELAIMASVVCFRARLMRGDIHVRYKKLTGFNGSFYGIYFVDMPVKKGYQHGMIKLTQIDPSQLVDNSISLRQ